MLDSQRDQGHCLYVFAMQPNILIVFYVPVVRQDALESKTRIEE